MQVLVTGGAGYIGSHTCLELLLAGHQVTVFDNLSNASSESLRRVSSLTGKPINFVQGDLLDTDAVEALFAAERPDAVIHFAGLKAVGESVQQPLWYYQNNVTGTIHLLQAMERHSVWRLVFSSSATVYGRSIELPLTEESPTSIDEVTNPYGRSKLILEHVLRDWHVAQSQARVVLLRYFNPVGAHGSGDIGEDPQGIPNNLFPYVAQVAVGRREQLQVYGDDYPTPDGTGVRDYIHVYDLAVGHLKAMLRLEGDPGLWVYNLGTGTGHSVLEVIQAFSAAAGVEIPYRIVDRRPGDVAACYADPGLAERELGWRAERNLQEMCVDGWRWQSKNPRGYDVSDSS